MNKIDFELDTKAFRENVLQADFMLSAMTSEANKRKTSETHIKPFIGFDRAKAIIYPNTKEHTG